MSNAKHVIIFSTLRTKAKNILSIPVIQDLSKKKKKKEAFLSTIFKDKHIKYLKICSLIFDCLEKKFPKLPVV